jgi:MerR family transcriptional regulator/heat shock protein HspR
MFGVHQQTIRLYEKEGLITPSRTAGNTRQFTEEDVERLEEVIYLTHQLGVNLAGVGMILKLKKKIKKMQSEMNLMFEKTKERLDDDNADFQKQSREKFERLMHLKKANFDRSNSGGQKGSDWIDQEDDTEAEVFFQEEED